MRSRLLTVLLAAFLLACSCPLITQAVPTTSPLPTSTAPLPTSTVAATASPTITPSPTPSVPQVAPISLNVNCREGPDVATKALSVLLSGHIAQIAGRNDDGTWWYISDPDNPGGFCWVDASVVTAAGNLTGVPIKEAPSAMVTSVTVEVSAPSAIICGEPNPLEFSGTITTDEAVTVKFQWEVRGDKSSVTPPETLVFNKAATNNAPDPGPYNVDCGSYSVTLHVLSPNDISATRKFEVRP
jgi:SH3-like domain-containing protein